MQNVQNNCDISVFDGRIGYISPALALLLLFCFLRDHQTNALEMRRSDMVKALSDNKKQPAERTVKGYINLLCQNGAIKYKYETERRPGRLMINPRFCYAGTAANYGKAIEAWNAFKSDIPPYDESYARID